MKKSCLFTSTLIAAVALSTPAFALDGDGSESSPYYGTITGTEIFSTSDTTTVYVGTDSAPLGGDGTNSYFAGHNSTTYYVSNIVINAGGIYITNGNGSDYHYYSGTITGTGDWTVTYVEGASDNSGNTDVTQRYSFTGDLSGWSGNFKIYTVNTGDYVYYGNGNVAATNTNISGNGGSISVDFGEVQYNYTGYAEGTSASALTVTNSSIEAHKVTFTGSVNYEVSSTITGWDGSGYNKGGTTETKAENSTLTISNTGTTTFSGSVSNFDIVTVSSSSTLAIASTGSLDLSGTTVNLGSTIKNSGSLTLDSSTTSFVIDGFDLDFEGDWSTGATYTLISNVGYGTITGYDDLTISNVSSASSTIESAIFSFDNGTLTVTVTGTFVLADGLHGSGKTADNAYFTTGGTEQTQTTVSFDVSNFTGKGTTVYLATDEYSLGNAYENIYWSGSVNAECDIVIGAAGIHLTNGTSSNIHTFSGAISGTGDWIVTGEANDNANTVTQHYVFTGDMSEWSGDFSITSGGSSYVHYGNGQQAATDTNVSGTGSISVSGNSNSEITFNYSGYADESSTAIAIGNESISAPYIKFDGSVNYEVKNITVAESSTTQLTKSTAVTLTVSLTDLVLGDGATFTLYADTHPTSSVGGLSIGTVTIAEGATSVAMKTSHWETYVGIANLVGKDVTLTLDSSSDSDSGATIFELGTSGNTESTSQFTGKIVLSDDASAGNSGTGHRAASLVISEANIAAGAVIEFGTETVSQYSLSLGVNAETVVVAGLVSSADHTGGDIVYSGTLDMNVSPGDGGASLIDYKSEDNAENFTHVGTSRNTLVINTAENTEYSFSGVFLDMLNIEKTGTGTQSITFQKSQYGSTGYYFDGTITVNEGKLNLSGEETNSSGITVVSGATLTIANSITLAATDDIKSVSSTISGTLSVTETGSLALSGTVDLSSAIQNAGLITIADGTSITVGVEVQTGEYDGKNYDYYTLISGSGDSSVTVGDNVTFIINGESITLDGIISTLANGDSTWGGYMVGGNLIIYTETSTIAQTSDDLVWAGEGGNNTWDTGDSTNTIWNDATTGDSGYYFTEGNNVTFGPNTDGSLSSTVVLGDDITAGTVNITGSGYTLTGDGKSLTATSIVLDDEESDDSHTFTIGKGVTVTATTLTESAGQLDLVINGELNVTGEITIDSTSNEVISGAGKLTAGTLTYDAVRGSSLTISVAEATFDTLAEKPSGENDSPGSGYRTLIIGDTSSGHTTTVTAGNMELRGQSIIQVTEGSSFTVTGELLDASGYSTTISGDGSVKIGSLNVSGSSTSGSTLTISVANFEADSAVFSGTNNVSISSANVTIGAIESSNTHTITIETGGKLTTGEIYRSGSTLNLTVNGELYVEKLEAYESSTGMLYFGKSGSATDMAQTLSGSGTANIYGIEANLNNGSLTISVANLNIGAGGITRYGSGSGTVTINGTKVGLYNTNASTISADMTIGESGVTFNMNSGETMTISGALSGSGKIEKTGVGTLVLSAANSLTGTVTISAGTVEVTNGSALGSSTVSVSSGAKLQLDTAVSTSGTVTFSGGAKLVIGGDLLAELSTSYSATESGAVAIITASNITFGETSLSEYESISGNDTFDSFINSYVSAGDYMLTWSWSYIDGTGILSASVTSIPEPGIFSTLFGLGALGLVATRRRRRA